MKKTLAGIVVILMAGVLVFRHLDRVKTEGASRPASGSSVQVPEGGSLPGGEAEGVPFPEHQYIRLSSGALESLPAQLAECVKNVKDVTGDYEYMWDEFSGKKGDKKIFTGAGIKVISTLMSDYYSCKALASRDVKFCEELSNRGSTVFTPRYVCRERYNFLSYMGYMAGKTENKTPCLEYLTEDRRKGLKLSAEDVCAASRKGLPELCENLFLDPHKNFCRGHFPKSESDCNKSNPRCLEMLGVYNAFKTGDPARCPDELREFCEAFLKRSEVPCSNLKNRFLLTFCDISKKVAELREEENRREEEKKVFIENNKKTRETEVLRKVKK